MRRPARSLEFTYDPSLGIYGTMRLEAQGSLLTNRDERRERGLPGPPEISAYCRNGPAPSRGGCYSVGEIAGASKVVACWQDDA